MAKSRAPGTSSSSLHLLKEAEVHAQLARLSKNHIVQKIAASLGAEADLHLVGGTVRDLALGQDAADVDMATILHPEVGAERMRQAGIRVVDTALKHGTIIAVIDETNVEITTFRQPSDRDSNKYSRSIEEDLSGRDFTINAIAYSPTKEALVDPHGGLDDLRQGILRAVGSAEARFSEDPLRLLRMVRFGPAQCRTIDAATEAAARKLVESITKVSVERIRDEIENILVSEDPAEGMRTLQRMGLMRLLLPELEPMVGFEQNAFHIHDVFEHTLDVIGNTEPDPVMRLAALFHDTGKPHTLSVDEKGNRHFYLHEVQSRDICEAVMTRLRYSHEMIHAVSTLVRLHMRPLDCGPQGVRRLMRDLGPYFGRWIEFKKADATPVIPKEDFNKVLSGFQELVQEEENRQKGSVYGKLAVDGYDLIELGMKPGVALGKVLKQLEEAVIENPDVNEKEKLLELARSLRASSS